MRSMHALASQGLGWSACHATVLATPTDRVGGGMVTAGDDDDDDADEASGGTAGCQEEDA